MQRNLPKTEIAKSKPLERVIAKIEHEILQKREGQFVKARDNMFENHTGLPSEHVQELDQDELRALEEQLIKIAPWKAGRNIGVSLLLAIALGFATHPFIGLTSLFIMPPIMIDTRGPVNLMYLYQYLRRAWRRRRQG